MTRASGARNVRRGKVGFQRQLQAAFMKGRMSLAQELASPAGLKCADGRVMRILIEGTATTPPTPIGGPALQASTPVEGIASPAPSEPEHSEIEAATADLNRDQHGHDEFDGNGRELHE
jgi:hypothetical protein